MCEISYYNSEKTPPGFIGLNEKSQSNRIISSINVNQELSKDGSVDLVIEGETQNFSIQSSQISHYVLNNGKSFSTTISFIGIVETGEEFFFVPMGTTEKGQVVLAFGDDNFATQEIQELIRGEANIEWDSL